MRHTEQVASPKEVCEGREVGLSLLLPSRKVGESTLCHSLCFRLFSESGQGCVQPESHAVMLRDSLNFCYADRKGALKNLWNGSGPS